MGSHRRNRSSSPGRFASSLLEAVFACVVSYCLVSLVAGQAGLLAANDLRGRISGMADRIRRMESENQSLQGRMELLKSSADRMALEARDLNLIADGERVVIMPEGSTPDAARTHGQPAAEVLRVGVSSGLPDGMVKLLAAVIGFGVFVASLMLGYSPRRRAAREPDATA